MLTTIKSPRDIDALFGSSARAANRAIVVLARKTPEGRGPTGRVVFVAGKKLGSAVARNRSKRVVRASMIRQRLSWDGWDVALIARPDTATLKAPGLDAGIRAALDEAGVIDE